MLRISKNIVFAHEAIDLGKIILEEDIDLLDEVTISAVVPVQIKKRHCGF